MSRRSKQFEHVVGISFYIITHYDNELFPCDVKTKTTCTKLRNTVVPKINSIFQDSNIRFVMDECKTVKAEKETGPVFDDGNIRAIERLFDQEPIYDHGSINVFIVPLISNYTNAYTLLTKNSFIVMADSVELEDGCKLQPIKDFSVILAHEIGHDLGLPHVSQKLKNLMTPISPHDAKLDAMQLKKVYEVALRKYPMQLVRKPSRPRTSVYETCPHDCPLHVCT